MSIHQPIKNKQKNKQNNKQGYKIKRKPKKPEYGTSKLEDKFANIILEQLNIQYQRQYKAKDIGRFFDFIIKTPQSKNVLIEVDGDYW